MTTMTEAEWDVDARAAALGLNVYEASLCSACGRPSRVCQASESEFEWVADDPIRCHARTAVLRKQDRMGDDVEFPEALLMGAALRSEVDR